MEGRGGAAGARAEAVERSVKVWTGQLVDLSARNNLLFFRDLKVGTLDLGRRRRKSFSVSWQERQPRSPAFLWVGRRLLRALRWLSAPLDGEVRDFGVLVNFVAPAIQLALFEALEAL
jgi:hypothetical protein